MKVVPFDPNDKEQVDAILKIPAFKPLGKDRLAEVMKMVTIRDYEKRETVITQGEVDQTMFFLMKGKLSIQVDGLEVNVLQKKHTVFGEMGIIDTAPRSASVVVKQPTRCLALDVGFMETLSGRAKLAVQAFFYKMFYQVLVQRLRETNGRIADMDMQKVILENMNID